MNEGAALERWVLRTEARLNKLETEKPKEILHNDCLKLVNDRLNRQNDSQLSEIQRLKSELYQATQREIRLTSERDSARKEIEGCQRELKHMEDKIKLHEKMTEAEKRQREDMFLKYQAEVEIRKKMRSSYRGMLRSVDESTNNELREIVEQFGEYLKN